MTTHDSAASRELPPDYWPHTRDSRWVQAAGVDWHVQDVGVGAPILLLHGAGASTHSMASLIDELSGEYRCVAVDLPGHAFSSPYPSGAYTLRRTARALDSLLAVLNIHPVALIGHSAGAAIALQWRLDHADTRAAKAPIVVAINPALLPFGGVAGLAFPVLARLAASSSSIAGLLSRHGAGTAQVERLIEGTGSQASDQMRRAYQALMKRPSHVRSVLAMMAGWQLDRLVASVRSLDPELLVLLSERDRAIPPQRTAHALSGLSNTRITYLPTLGHLAHEEAPGQIAEWIRDALNEPNGETEHGL